MLDRQPAAANHPKTSNRQASVFGGQTPKHGLDRPERSTSVIPARVVFLTHYVPLYQVQVLRAIAQRVREFHVLLSTPIEPNRNFELDWDGLSVAVQKTVTLRRRWTHRGVDSKQSFRDPLFVHVPFDTGSQLRRLNPDVVMSLELGARSLGAIRYCSRHTRTKSILCTYMSEHTERSRGRLRKHLRRYLIRRADAVTYNGPSCQAYLRTLGASKDQLYQLPYAADDRTVYRGSVRRDDLETRHRLLTVGQLTERKGVLPMLRQVSDFCRRHPDRTIELALAGDGPLRAEIEQFSAADNLHIHVLGSLRPDQVRDQMARCGALIAPTLADEWLLVVNEALQAGLPVIGSVYAQAVTTLVRDGINGWQYRPESAGSLSRTLDRYFAESAASLLEMRQRCRESVSHCTPRWAAEGAVEAIAAVIGDADRHPPTVDSITEPR